MSNYSVIKTNKTTYCCVVIATSYMSPMSTLDDLQVDLGKMSGNVLFDMTLINGISSNRYISAQLKQGVFDRKTFKIVSNITDPVLEISREFFMTHPSIVDGGVIPSSLKHLLKRGQLV